MVGAVGIDRSSVFGCPLEQRGSLLEFAFTKCELAERRERPTEPYASYLKSELKAFVEQLVSVSVISCFDRKVGQIRERGGHQTLLATTS